MTMVQHPRTPIREAIVATLVPLTLLGGRVKGTRLETGDTEHLPAATVITIIEPVARDTLKSYLRTTKFQVTGTVHAGSDPDRQLDEFAAVVEPAIAASLTSGPLKGLVQRIDLVETRFEFRSANAAGQTLAKPIARIGLIYEAVYRTTTAGTGV